MTAICSSCPNSGVAAEDGGLRLRLAFAAHRAVGHDAAVVEAGHRRVQRVERAMPGASALTVAASSWKLPPQLCQSIPVSHDTTPEPNSQ